MDHIFQIFGSKGSLDYDIVVFVEQLGSIIESKCLCDYYDNVLYDLLVVHGYDPKPVNTNLAVLKDGYISEVYKGSKDEVNNSLLDTYEYHDLAYSL